MSLQLAKFPVEILANVTSRIPDREVLLLAIMCGNSILRTKLQTGGLEALQFKLPELSESLYSMLRGFRFYSVNFESLTCNITHLKNLIRGLPSTLRHLSVNHTESIVILMTEDLDLEPLFPMTSCRYLPWHVSSSFPQLETFQLDGHRRDSVSDFGTNFQVRFLLGLPPTLTALRLRSLGEKCNIDLWPFLPPHLTSLGHILGLPSTRLPLSLQESLRAINTRAFELTHPGWQKSLGRHSWAPVINFHLLAFPSRLTTITLQSEKLRDLESIPDFPASLETLFWTSSKYIFGHPHSLLVRLPETIKRVDLNGFIFQKPPGPRRSFTQLVFPKIDHFGFIFELPHTSTDDAITIRSYALRCVLNASSIKFHHRGTQHPLTPQELSLLDGEKMRSLKASLDSACFLSTAGSPTLAQLFPRLETLKLLPPARIAIPAAAIPPCITLLDLALSSISVASISQLPPSLTQLSAGKVTVKTLQEILPLFKEKDLTSLHLFEKISFGRVEHNGTRKSLEASNTMEVQNSSFDSPSMTLEYDAEFWIRSSSLPQSLTSLQLSPSVDVNVMSGQLTPTVLPNLTKLAFASMLVPYQAHMLAKMTTLKVLHCAEISTPSSFRCPPNLEELRITCSIDFLESYVSLPKTITSLSSDGHILPIATFSSLTNLRTLGMRTTKEQPEPLNLLSLPTTLTDIDIPLSDNHQSAFKTIATRFSGIKRVRIPHVALETDMLNHFHDIMPPGAVIEGRDWNPFTKVEAILRRSDAPHGSVTILPGISLGAWMRPYIQKAYPRLDYGDTFPNNLESSAFSSIGPYFSDSVKSLDFTEYCTALHLDFPKFLPPKLETFVGNNVTFGAFRVDLLPRTLKSLVIDEIIPHKIDFEALPRGLEQLCLRGQKLFSSALAAQLPPNLLVLEMPGVSLTKEDLAVLPKSLTILKVSAWRENLDFSELPPGLKLLDIGSSTPRWTATPTKQGMALLRTTATVVDHMHNLGNHPTISPFFEALPPLVSREIPEDEE